MGVLVEVCVLLGVGDSSAIVGVKVGTNVGVAVRGAGEGSTLFVAVTVACGTNSTNEMDNAPTIKPTEIKATTSALPKSRKCIISSLWLY
jgi:hypothetical protein